MEGFSREHQLSCFSVFIQQVLNVALTSKNSLAEETVKDLITKHDCAAEGSCGSRWSAREGSWRMGTARRSGAGAVCLEE